MKITATFLDEISTDIPHQNWGEEEWRNDFQCMVNAGINTVVLIRCGLERWITYPSPILMGRGAYKPKVDLVEMFLRLSDDFGMNFFFGTYVAHRQWWEKDINFKDDLEIDKLVIAEAWERYGHHKSFGGWYLSKEISTKVTPIVDEFVELGMYCKEISGNLPVLISPGMLGRKAYLPGEERAHDLDFERHCREWDEIMGTIAGAVDIVAFQDGHVQYWELPDILKINKKLADKHGLECWTNTETFDRDMPFRFPPIKWDKLLLKLDAARYAGINKSITFEFSHFLSPNSFWPTARHLYNRYMDYLAELQGVNYARK